MGNIGFAQLLLIALIVLLIFGATRLPEVGRGLGRGVARLRRGMRDSSAESKAVLTAAPSSSTKSRRRRGLAA